ncbi:MAG: ECF transporter S component [Clostridiales bacterium]|jgi:energy-coupling factor transport system substrate-specific component|nr:ECF transporter S component [Clostridiales bacterium]
MQEKGKARGLKAFPVFDLVLLAMLSGLSIAFKVVVGTLVRMITGPIGIPGGALAGGLYMLWLSLAIVLTGRRGSALVVSGVQTIVLLTSGLPGSHGFWTLLTYLLPAVLVEIVYLIKPKNGYTILHSIIATILANITGTYVVATVLANLGGTDGGVLPLMSLELYPLLFMLLAAAFSGAVGGVLGHLVFLMVSKTGLVKSKNKERIVNPSLLVRVVAEEELLKDFLDLSKENPYKNSLESLNEKKEITQEVK